MQKRVGTYRGSGTVNHNGIDHQVQYTIEVWQEYIQSRTLSGTTEIPGLQTIGGKVSPVIGDAFLSGKTLTLSMGNGLKLPFFFVDASGSISATGGFANA